ncbi:Retrovirus-related Pol polyprotein from transposon RE1 [Vitis vinifera]|uniref:Retrovirus-related Pol polyprotein from transposon RE1 n=1 Tax=Vitis vinifera TaxID=29760 RepID=A0A438BLZ3_VITVI|nr:Retrovirus-related Pol polyprotein from transposon RE1 [Vitis vinifera]
MATKSSTFSSVISGSPMITLEKLVGSENYLSWSAFVEFWFMGQGYEDHLVTQEADILEVDRVQWRKIDAQLCSVLWQSVDPKILLHLRAYKHALNFGIRRKGYTRMISNVFIRLTSSSWFLRLLASVQISRPSAIRFLAVPPFHHWMMCLLASSVSSSTQTLPSDNTLDSSVLVSQTNSRGGRSGNRGRSQRPHCTYCNKLGHTRDRVISYMGGLPALPTEYDDYLRYQATKSASVASVAQTDNAFACLYLYISSWTLDSNSGTSDHTSGPEYGEDDWYRTLLGHPSLSKFQKMVPPFFIFVVACVQVSFELIHTDVWGPCRTAFILRFQYFVTFIDDYSRLTMPGIFFCTIYFIYVPTWDHSSVFLCSYSSTKWVAERKNRHLVETARTLLLHSNVPFRFWGRCSYSMLLINRMPSSVLHDQIPHSLLFPDQPLYFLPSRVFGCTCFVHILTPGQDKLSIKPQNASSWDILDFKRVIVVIPLRLIATFSPLDVTFFEDSPFFSTSESLPVSEVYHRCHRVAVPPSLAEVPADSLPIPSASPARLCLLLLTYLLLFERLATAMVDEMAALHSNDTWDLVVLPSGKSTVGCRWVYTVKVGPDGQVDRLKARLVAKGYTQVYGSDYGDTFSPVAKIAFVRLLLSMAAMFLASLSCAGYAFSIWLKQSPRAWFSRFSSVVQEFGMFRNTTDHSVFYHHNSSGQCIYLVVYVDDIVITGSDQNGIQKLKQHLFTHFQTKDLGKLKYFLGIEIAQSSSGVVLSQRKYALDILEETGLLDCKPVDTLMDPNVKLYQDRGSL